MEQNGVQCWEGSLYTAAARTNDSRIMYDYLTQTMFLALHADCGCLTILSVAAEVHNSGSHNWTAFCG